MVLIRIFNLCTVLSCSVNLMAVLSSLTNIGKQRPSLLHTVIQSFESLHGNILITITSFFLPV